MADAEVEALIAQIPADKLHAACNALGKRFNADGRVTFAFIQVPYNFEPDRFDRVLTDALVHAGKWMRESYYARRNELAPTSRRAHADDDPALKPLTDVFASIAAQLPREGR